LLFGVSTLGLAVAVAIEAYIVNTSIF